MYLWQRGYGTPVYGAWPLIRLLDGKVARLIGFDGARANYARLQELPLRLREHADRKKHDAEAAVALVRGLDEKVCEGGGVGQA